MNAPALVRRAAGALLSLALCAAPVAYAQQAVARVQVTPATLTLGIGDSVRLDATAFDAAGGRTVAPIAWFSDNRRAVSVDSTGMVKAMRAGTYSVTAAVLGNATARTTVAVTVAWPPVRTVEITEAPGHYYAGITTRHRARVTDASGAVRDNVPVTWSSSNPAVLRVDRYGQVTAVRTGRATLRVQGESVTGEHAVTVLLNPARTIVLTATADSGRTGDVIRFTAQARDAAGREIADYPVTFSVSSAVEDTVIASEAPALVEQDGRFVAQRAGVYSVTATGGTLSASHTVAIGHRFTSRRIATPQGQGRVSHVHTSDLWVWTARDGRSYAVTGTWGGNGVAYFWDVTDPAAPVKVDSVQVDARTVNDVKVDAARGLCVISREGASNRRNGLVVLDCSDPRHVQILSRFDDNLLGGVHNVFIWNQHVFAINAGRRFDVVSIEDPRNPRRVGFFELDTPGHGIHDIWVEDGIAYTSNWADGVLLIDVGNGAAGGSPANPVVMSRYRYPIGATHSAFPYTQATGRRYVFVGDEQFPYGLDPDVPDEAAGYVHVVDFTDLQHPREVARYQIPEAGPHNFWVQSDTLYVAYYNAGLRAVDVSGELMGNLYTQGREVARFQAFDPNGKVANAPMAWGPQPHNGFVFFTDFNSGLYSVRIAEPQRPAIP